MVLCGFHRALSVTLCHTTDIFSHCPLFMLVYACTRCLLLHSGVDKPTHLVTELHCARPRPMAPVDDIDRTALKRTSLYPTASTPPFHSTSSSPPPSPSPTTVVSTTADLEATKKHFRLAAEAELREPRERVRGAPRVRGVPPRTVPVVAVAEPELVAGVAEPVPKPLPAAAVAATAAAPTAEQRARRMWMFQLYLTWCIQSALCRLKNGSERSLLSVGDTYVRGMQYGAMGLSAGMRRVMLYFPSMAVGGSGALREWVYWRSSCRAFVMVWRLTDINRMRADDGRTEVFGGQEIWRKRAPRMLPAAARLAANATSSASTDLPFVSRRINERVHTRPAGPPAFLPPAGHTPSRDNNRRGRPY